MSDLSTHAVVSPGEWLAARKELLAREKEFTRLRDQLSQERRDLPWKTVEKEYVFEGGNGKRGLAELFDGKSQLIVYHFMFAPEWDAGCLHCSFWADNFERTIVHLNQRDTGMVAISRAPYSKLAAYKARMGWTFDWLSSFATDFNYDYAVAFTPEQWQDGTGIHNFTNVVRDATDHAGVSVFSKRDDGRVYHTYSTYSRGLDMLNTAYHYLDLTPKGRDEAGHDDPQFWVRRHDEYGH
ncbi:MAG TPA: DUF899 domain-containing protein [Dehalococcoidia bacterium]|nr:DUF899 domain-containing protein [Dehalococcoidia bacterium]